jgi:hypothetical protein
LINVCQSLTVGKPERENLCADLLQFGSATKHQEHWKRFQSLSSDEKQAGEGALIFSNGSPATKQHTGEHAM